MANPEHLAILKQGVEIWNEWRKERRDILSNSFEAYLIEADFNEADLIESDVIDIDLNEVDFIRSGLSPADSSNCDFSEANLNGVNLSKVDFSEGNLRKVNLIGAILREADFGRADLLKADLREADLREAHFSEAYPHEANFIRADLRKAHLSVADFERALLREAVLSEAIIRDSVLSEADLCGANLRGADLQGTLLIRVNLTGADLRGADLSNAFVGSTIFGAVDLSMVKGLETLEHWQSSTVGMDTIFISKGKIPEAFLRGCGLSDLDIEYAKLGNPDLTPDQLTDITYKIHELYRGGGSIQYFSIFISYSTKDGVFAQKLHDDLQNSGVRCWFAPHDIQAGKKIHEQIDSAIRVHDRLLLILSDHSMNSEWVKTEIANARQKEIEQNRQVLFPISIIDYEQIKKWKCFDADRGKDSAREIREYFIPDFSKWRNEDAYNEAFERLIRDLKAPGGSDDKPTTQ